MIRTIRLLLIPALLMLIAENLNASILSDYLSFDGIVDILEDDSRASFFNNDDSEVEIAPGIFAPTLSVGDVIYGYLSISDGTPGGDPSPNEIVALFAFEIAGTTLSHESVSYFTHKASTVAGQTLTELVLPEFAPKATLAGAVSDAAFVILTNEGLPARNPLSPEIPNIDNDASGDPDLKGFLSSEWNYELTGGFVDSDDFLHLERTGASRAERGGFTVQDHVFSSDTVFLGVEVFNFGDADGFPLFGPTSTHDITLSGSVAVEPGGTVGGWAFTDSSDFAVNPVPEPSSMMAWGILAAVGVGVIQRKRRKNAT